MQGGCYEFPMARAPLAAELAFPEYPSVRAGIVRWPMSVIRLRSANKDELLALADVILDAWRAYSDPSALVFAETDGVPHNTVTPIARRRDEDFELDLVLRNNLTTPEYPMGVFHPHADKHNIKKENIGLIEVMGLAVLPSRLKAETERLASLIMSGADIASDPVCGKHAEWLARFRGKYREPGSEYEALTMLRAEVGATFVDVLRDAGVFKDDAAGRAAMLRFAASVGAVTA